MKKVFTVFALLTALALHTQAQVQDENAAPRMDPQRAALQKMRITKTLGVSTEAADSIVAINAEQRPAKMALARDNSLDYSAKEAQFEAMRQVRRTRLLKVMTPAQIDALDKSEADARAKRAERQLQ